MTLCRRVFRVVCGTAAILICSTLLGSETPRGDVWLVSTRAAAHCGAVTLVSQPISYWRLDEHCCWQEATLAAFDAANADDPCPTFVFIHGDRADADDALVAAGPVRCALQAGKRPFRLVIWSWPSSRVYRSPRHDAQLKEGYTPQQSHYLAEFVTHVDPRAEVCFIGFSFGARIAVGTLHLFGGGAVAGRTFEATASRPAVLRAVIVASAFECGGLAANRQFGLALSAADEILVTRNARDPALHFFPRLHGRGGPEALGYAGAAGVSNPKLKILDVTAAVGKHHAWLRYAAQIRLAGLLVPSP